MCVYFGKSASSYWCCTVNCTELFVPFARLFLKEYGCALIVLEIMKWIFVIGLILMLSVGTCAQYLQFCTLCTCSFETVIRVACLRLPPSHTILQMKNAPVNILFDFTRIPKDDFERLKTFEDYLFKITSNLLLPDTYNNGSTKKGTFPTSAIPKKNIGHPIIMPTLVAINTNGELIATSISDSRLTLTEKGLISGFVVTSILCIMLSICLILMHIRQKLQSNVRVLQMQNLEL